MFERFDGNYEGVAFRENAGEQLIRGRVVGASIKTQTGVFNEDSGH